MNILPFLLDQKKYFASSYEQFQAFGGPSVYFHVECLRAAVTDFLSHRHIEMLYATLASWGMHRMGDIDQTKTKLTDWAAFQASIVKSRRELDGFRELTMLGMDEAAYAETLSRLQPVYAGLNLAVSGATVVVNSKALHHILPSLVPPIDRQYTIRFLTQAPEYWHDSKGGYRTISLPAGFDPQFRLFRDWCLQLKGLADRVDPDLFEEQQRRNGVPPPKALDNAIVNYERIVSRELAPRWMRPLLGQPAGPASASPHGVDLPPGVTSFELRLADTYWERGFFNVPVAFEQFLTKTDGPMEIFVGDVAEALHGRIDRRANQNGTPRIIGSKALAQFFQRGYQKGQSVAVEIVSPTTLRIGRRSGAAARGQERAGAREE